MSLSPIEEGIKKVGVGKNTTKECDKELVDKILTQLQSGETDDVQKATFLGALKVKGASGEELRISEHIGESYGNDTRFIQSLDAKASAEDINLTKELLEGKTLDRTKAKVLGNKLMGKEFSASLKALVAVILRMRHTNLDEYDGLLEAVTETFDKNFVGKVDIENPIVQISEPFDGHKRGYLISPLYAYYLKQQGFTVIQNSGQSSGPKFGINSQSMIEPLGLDRLNGLEDINSGDSEFGYILEQERLSKDLEFWQGLRKKMIKRPFLATLEKYVNPFQADVLICSSFHDTFYDKGLQLAKVAGFKVCINIIRGLEGGCGLSLKRKTKATMFVKQENSYEELEFEVQPEDFEIETANDQLIRDLNIEKNAQLIKSFVANSQHSGDDYFDLRARYSLKFIEFLMSKAYPEKSIHFFNSQGS